MALGCWPITEQWHDRRSKRRFRLEQEVRYERLDGIQVLDAGTGKTLDMSSGAVHFTTNRPLRRGDTVRLAVDWPVLLEATRLKMVIYGRVLRSDGYTAAVTFGRYELRTRAGNQEAFLPGIPGPDANATS